MTNRSTHIENQLSTHLSARIIMTMRPYVTSLCLALVFASCGSTKISDEERTDGVEKIQTTTTYEGPNGTIIDSNKSETTYVPPNALSGDETSRDVIYLGSDTVLVGQGEVVDRDVQTGESIVVNIDEATPARRLRRMSAEQFNNSLTTATGQSWSQFAAFAGVLGKPNYVDSMEENLAVSVGFIKLAGDAARDTCGKAINNDDGTPVAQRVIMQNINISKPTKSQSIATLKYLFRRFHSTIITADDDPRLIPFLGVLDDTLDDDLTNDDEVTPNFQGSRDEIKSRWLAVCVGLVMHPDFYSY